MAKYNCSSFDQYANMLKKDIKAAMRGKIRIPADVEECECGFVEVDASKEQCEKIILNSVEEIVNHSFADVKHGHWVFVNDMVSYIKCSECGDDICWVNTKRPKYCPNCGARMDGDAND